MTLSAWLRHIKQNKETTSLQFIAKAKCSRANDFGITLSENHFKCAMGSNSSISFDLQCGGEEGGLGNISYHGIVIPALELYNAHAMSTSIIEWSKWPIFFARGLPLQLFCSCAASENLTLSKSASGESMIELSTHPEHHHEVAASPPPLGMFVKWPKTVLIHENMRWCTRCKIHYRNRGQNCANTHSTLSKTKSVNQLFVCSETKWI